MKRKSVAMQASRWAGAAGCTPIRAMDAASFLTGKEIGPKSVQEAAQRWAAAAEPIEDIRGSEEYKHAALKSLFKQAIAAVLRRSHGETIQVDHVR